MEPTPESSSLPTDSAVVATRTNTILYCTEWAPTAAFYREVIGLRSGFENDWFVEFELGDGAHLSVADAARATIAPGDGRGITLSWEIDEFEAVRRRIVAQGVVVSEPTVRWGATTVFLHDPSGNRIELWSPVPEQSRQSEM